LHRISEKYLVLKNALYTLQKTNNKSKLIQRLNFSKEPTQFYLTDYADIKDRMLAGFINGGGLLLFDKKVAAKTIGEGKTILRDVNITDIEKQNDEKVWVATSDNGLYLLDYSLVSDVDINIKIGNQKDVTYIKFFSDSLFVGNRHGEVRIITNTSVRKCQLSTPNIYNEIHGIFKVLENKYLIISKDAIALSDGNTKLWEKPAKSESFVKDCTEDDTHIYISQRDIYTIINKADLTSREIQLSHITTTMVSGTNGKLFFGGPRGLYIDSTEFNLFGSLRIYRLRNWRELVVMCTNKGVFYLDSNGKPINTPVPPESIGELVKRAFIDDNQNLYLLSDKGFFFSKTLGEYIPLILFGNNNAINNINYASFTDEYCYIHTNQGLFQLKKPITNQANLSSGPFSRIVANNNYETSPRDNVNRKRYSKASNFFYSLETIDFNRRDGEIIWELTDQRTSKVLQRESIREQQPFVPFKLRPGDYKITAQLFSGGKIAISEAQYLLFITPLFRQEPLFIFALTLIGIIAFYFGLKYTVFYLARRQTRKYQKEHDLAFLRQSVQISRMKPHFLFNSFNPIQAFILQGKKMEALEYISSLTKMLRTSMNLFEKEFVALQEELSFLQNYLQVEDVKNEDAYECRITIDDTIDLNKVYVPTMMLQPLVENAIIHARTEGQPVKIALHIQQHQQQLIITVSDNGPGFNDTIHQHPGHALEVVKKRILLIRKLHNVGQIDFWNDNGANIKITLPFLTSRPT
jgi:two-component sensor histidine kinase